MKKFGAVSAGILMGLLSGGMALAATEIAPNDPYIYNQPGSRSGGGGGTSAGKFGSIQQVGTFLLTLIQSYLIPLIMSLALLAFLWGVLQFIRKGTDPKEREQGRQFMLWGIIGLAVMASVWGLVRILTNTIGVPLGIPSVSNIR